MLPDCLVITPKSTACPACSPRKNPSSDSAPSAHRNHTISYAGLVGGGRWSRPNEISLAHRGMLFLDELPEFGQQILEAVGSEVSHTL